MTGRQTERTQGALSVLYFVFIRKLTFGSDRFSTYTLVPLTTSKNDYVIHYPQESGNSSILQENGGKQEGGHSHQFEWKTITTPTEEADGLEAYACHLQFEYLHKQYEVLIPAKMPMDTECEWYGPLKLCNLYPYIIK
ncbi:MAG TPA: hypothetical protein DEW33_05720 [Lachnospiraceae bacterium]|nr:hypothetical protein [Lachnospiraceae bacterium]